MNNDYSKLRQVRLNESELECECYIHDVSNDEKLIGVIVFKGEYKKGSAGKHDARFIKWRIDEFCDKGFPLRLSGLIVDLRELDYVWGDDFVINPGELRRKHAPIRIVIPSPDSDVRKYEAFKWAIGEDELRLDFVETISEISRLVKESKSSD